LFLAGLYDSQLVYAIKITIPTNELTFDNVVERYQRCHATEWGATPTLEPGEGADRPGDSTFTGPNTTNEVILQAAASAMKRSARVQEQ
jgi:hypothetical protein